MSIQRDFLIYRFAQIEKVWFCSLVKDNDNYYNNLLKILWIVIIIMMIIITFLKTLWKRTNCTLQFFKTYSKLLSYDFIWKNVFNPFPNKPWFLRVCSISLLKTLWEKDKLLVTSNLSFSHSVFYPFEKLFVIFIKFEIVVCGPFEFGKV